MVQHHTVARGCPVRGPWLGSGPDQFNDEGDAVMRRRLAARAVLSALALSTNAKAATPDPIGDMIMSVVTGSMPGAPGWNVKATLYHAGAKGVAAIDSLGCRVQAMRTVAVDKDLIPKGSILFIKETVGLKMPDGRV